LVGKTSSRTKLVDPKLDSTMVMLEVFLILLTHICSALYSMPKDQFWRSNVFSPRHKLPFSGQHKSEIFCAGCWHICNQINTTTKQRHIPKNTSARSPSSSYSQLRKGVRAMSYRAAALEGEPLSSSKLSHIVNIGTGIFPRF
jgi:hypothetical protein